MSDVKGDQRTAPRIATRPGGLAPSRSGEPAPLEDEFGDEPLSEFMTAVLGSTSRHGEWEPADITRVFALMGNADLDFRRALLPQSAAPCYQVMRSSPTKLMPCDEALSTGSR